MNRSAVLLAVALAACARNETPVERAPAPAPAATPAASASCDEVVAWVSARETSRGDPALIDAVHDDIIAAGAGCPDIPRWMELRRAGVNAAVLAPALAEALMVCRCKVKDLATLQAKIAAAFP